MPTGHEDTGEYQCSLHTFVPVNGFDCQSCLSNSLLKSVRIHFFSSIQHSQGPFCTEYVHIYMELCTCNTFTPKLHAATRNAACVIVVAEENK